MKAPGFSVVEAIVGAGLAGIAIAGLTAVAALATQSVALARDSGIALSLATERLESLRLGPRTDGNDTATGAGGTVFSRTWTQGGGRGAPIVLSTRIVWGTHVIDLRTEAPR